ncbi:MAG: hypothetical protein FJY91_02375 [Candidatus Harrisonbacteria bacterium]|nr:hypothetical protein [Candidatus Harrisonbacteria bacterium]
MYDFILQILFFSSLSLIIFLLARALPRIQDEDEGSAHLVIFFERLVNRLPLDELDSTFGRHWDKFLRRVRLLVLKLDTYLNEKIKKRSKSPIPSSSIDITNEEFIEHLKSDSDLE